ncbi:MAG TPA: TonB-dependent receptor, partial [Vicinamibacteria bacterium]
MNRLLRAALLLALSSGLATLAPAPAGAQSVTSGTLSGQVNDTSGGAVPGATVTAVHEPTGTRYTDVTNGEGRFTFLNVRVGGPYRVAVQLSGFKEATQDQVQVRLGDEKSLAFKLELETVTETVTVTADAGSLIGPSNTGPASNVSQDSIEKLPTVARGIEDFARLSPYFDAKGSGDGTDRTVLAVAGRNNRYNNIQIDGAVNNDLFAISDSSAPGNASDGQPISIDAIQELQLVISPYDVRQGGFTGGGVNAVTRSGTNAIHGTAYYFFRSESLTGDGPDDRPIAAFDEKQFGASVGGPLQKDKVFFFVNLDWGRKETPSGFSLDGNSGQAFGHQTEVSRFVDIIKNKYGYDPGGLAEFIRDTPSDKVFGRLDFNLSDHHRLTLRHNFIKGTTDRGFPSSRTYYF